MKRPIYSPRSSRLDRDLGRKRFGDAGYAMEELVAEIGAAFCCRRSWRHAGNPRRPRRLYRVMAASPEERQARDLHRRQPRAEGLNGLSPHAAIVDLHRARRRDAGGGVGD